MNSKRTSQLLAAGVCATAILFAAGCGKKSDSASTTTTTTAAADTKTTTAAAMAAPTVSGAWARTSPSMTSSGAAYATIKGGAEDDKLIGVSVDASVAKTAELHEVVMADGTTMTGDMSTTTAMSDESTTVPMSGDMTTTTAMSGDMTTTTAMSGESTTAPMSGDMTTTTAMAGAMTMKPVESIDIPAGETVMLKPGSYHIMLMDLVKPLKTGDKIELTLKFEKAGEVKATAEVKDQ